MTATRALLLSGYFTEFQPNSAPGFSQVRVDVPVNFSQGILDAGTAMRGADGQPPFTVVVLTDARPASGQEVVEASAMAALTSLVAMAKGGMLEALAPTIAPILASLTAQVQAIADRSGETLQ